MALSFLLVVLITAVGLRAWRRHFRLGCSVLCFNYFFLPPYGTLTIQEPQNNGLAIACGIVKAHGGKIWAENGKAKGAIFAFAIPVEQKRVTEYAKLKENESES